MSFGSPTPIEVAVQGPSARREPAVRREGARGAGEGAFAARSAVCAAARLPVAADPDRPRSRRPVRRDDGGSGALAGRRHVVQPLHRPELLARSGQRQRLSDSGRDSAVEDRVDRRRRGPARDAAERASGVGTAARRGSGATWTTARRSGRSTATTCSASSASRRTFTASRWARPSREIRQAIARAGRAAARRQRVHARPGAGVRGDARPACGSDCCCRWS